jgi:hypothetical protein
MSSQSRLTSVVSDAARTLDERYDGYRAEVAKALTQTIRAQSETASDAARGREVDRIVEALGQQVRSKAVG